MTTIAVNNDMMCADSLCTDNGARSVVQKIYQVDDVIIGFAGDMSQGLMFIEWYRSKGQDEYPFDDNFEAVVLERDGSIYSYDSGLMPIKMEHEYYAIGSGKHAATAAMILGCNPIEAVEIAKRVDVCSDGELQVIKIADLPKPRRKKASKKKRKKK